MKCETVSFRLVCYQAEIMYYAVFMYANGGGERAQHTSVQSDVIFLFEVNAKLNSVSG